MNLRNLCTNKKLKIILAIVFSFFITISSCAVKNSIRQILSTDSKISKSHSMPINDKVFKYSVQCTFCKETESFLKGLSFKDFSFTDLQQAVGFVFIFFCGLCLVKKDKHPHYNTFKIRGSIPIFLQYRKLII